MEPRRTAPWAVLGARKSEGLRSPPGLEPSGTPLTRPPCSAAWALWCSAARWAGVCAGDHTAQVSRLGLLPEKTKKTAAAASSRRAVSDVHVAGQ